MDGLTVKTVSEQFGITRKAVLAAIASRTLSILSEKPYLLDPKEVNRWLQNRAKTQQRDKAGAGTSAVSEDVVHWADISGLWETDGWHDLKRRNGYHFIDLFSGAGGLSCGMVMAGFTPVASVEIMPEAVKTYQRNFVFRCGFDEKVETRDIRKPSVKADLYESVRDKHVHVIVGGFPCQGFSMAGNRVVTDERNSLYREMLEVVNHLKPEVVIMENVEGLRTMLNGQIEAKILEDYKAIGYDINVTVLNSADYKVAQTRRRVIFVGNRIGAQNLHPKPLLSPKHYRTMRDEIERFMDEPEDVAWNHEFTRHTARTRERIVATPEGKSMYGNYSDAWKKSPWEQPSCTVKENHGGVNLHPRLPRVLTPRELAALQSFPDDFIFEGAKKWQLVQIGNAVPPLLGKAIGLATYTMLHQAGVPADAPLQQRRKPYVPQDDARQYRVLTLLEDGEDGKGMSID